MKLHEAAFNILNALSGGRSSHGDHLSLEQLKFQILYWRATLIRREIEKNGRTLEMEQVLLATPLATSGAYKMTAVLPNVVRTKDFYGIIDVRIAGASIPLVNYQAAEFVGYSRFTSLSRRAFIREDRLYLVNPGAATTVDIRGLFENPEEAFNFNYLNQTSIGTIGLDDGDGLWRDSENEFPVSMDIYQRIFQIITESDAKKIATSPNDQTNNAASDKEA